MPPRKRKAPVKINVNVQHLNDDRKEITTILKNVQTNQHYHKQYSNKLRKVYDKMKHDEFTEIYIDCLKHLMGSDFNDFTDTGLKFMAEFVSTFQAEDMHPLFDSIFEWNLKTVSLNPCVRFRLCEFVNLMLNSLPDDGDIEEFHCNDIISYMFDRLKDISPHVRVQAIKALCRLQIINDPTDDVTKIFIFHLGYDPSPLVRQAVISVIARTSYTIPYILERLSDVDVKVRRSVVVHMSNFSLNKCTVEQRLVLFEEGLNDSSTIVRNATSNILLPQYLTLCNNNFVTFLSSIKSGSNESEMSRFRTVARMSLLEMFRSHEPTNLINVLPLIENDEQGSISYRCCIRLDELTPELSIFWATLFEFFRSDDSKSDYLEQIAPDLVSMCHYIAIFCIQMSRSYDQLTSQCILITLVDVLLALDFTEEIGRESVKNVVVYLLKQNVCNETIIESLIKICEKLIPTADDRLQFFVDIVHYIIHPIDVDESYFSCSTMNSSVDAEVKLITEKLEKLKRNGNMETSEQANVSVTQDDIASLEEYRLFLIISYVRREALILNFEQISNDNLLRALKFVHGGMCSKTVTRLIPSAYQLYEDVIRGRVESDNLDIKNWSLKCTATFSLMLRKLACVAYEVFCEQLFHYQVPFVWATSIAAIFQLINRYGIDFFDKNKKSDSHPANDNPSNQSLNNNNDELSTLTGYVSATDILELFHRYLDTSHDVDITCELIDGFGLLILHGRFFDAKIMSKLIVMFFNETVEQKVIQILCIFFETIIRRGKQKYILLSLSRTLTAVANNMESELSSVLKFFVQSMMVENKSIEMNAMEQCSDHNHLAIGLLDWMIENATDYKALNVISKEMLSLKLMDNDGESALNILDLVDSLLEDDIHKESRKNLKSFREMIPIGMEISSEQSADCVEEVQTEEEMESSNSTDNNNEEDTNDKGTDEMVERMDL